MGHFEACLVRHELQYLARSWPCGFGSVYSPVYVEGGCRADRLRLQRQGRSSVTDADDDSAHNRYVCTSCMCSY